MTSKVSKHRMVKRAAFTWEKAAPWAAAFGAPIIAKGVDAGADAIGKMMQARRKGQAYKDMRAESELFNQLPEDRTKKYFNTLHRFAPSMAEDPVVASGWVLNAMRQGDVAINPHQAFAMPFGDTVEVEKNKNWKKEPGVGTKYMIEPIRHSIREGLSPDVPRPAGGHIRNANVSGAPARGGQGQYNPNAPQGRKNQQGGWRP